MELKVDQIQELAPIKFNFEDLKKELLEKSQHYKTAVYTDETITVAKQDRANLNKLVKAVNDEKIRVKNEIMKPYLPFETQCKELMEIVKDAVENIDTQIKSFEQKQKDEKRTAIKQYFDEHIGLYENLIDFELILNERWLNVTYDIDKILQEIDELFSDTKRHLMNFDALVTSEETKKQVIDFYFKNIDNDKRFELAMEEAKRIEATKTRLEEMKRREEEKSVKRQTIIPQAQQEIVQEKIYELSFKTYITKEQMFKLKDFFVSNNIKYEKI